jgi:GDP-L-fucose synthase
MKILLTGGTGLIGSAVREECAKAGIECVAPMRAACDLLNPRQVISNFGYLKPTHVIHLAGRVGGIRANMNAQAEFWHDNMQMNLNVMEACRRYKVERMICCLSTCIFPDIYSLDTVMGPRTLMPELIHNGPPHDSNYGYAYAKRALDIGCRAYNEQYSTMFERVMPCNAFGPHDNFNLENSHVIPALIHKMHLAKQNGTKLEVWGSGTALREFVYSKDVARAIMGLLSADFTNIPVIISPGEERSIAIVVRYLFELMDLDPGMIEWDASKPEGQKRKPTDNSLLLHMLPGFKFTPLDLALAETVAWFKSNWPNVRK